VNRNAANVGGMVNGREGWRWPKKDGTPTREFLFVDDCVEALALAAEHYDGREPVNLGSGKEISIRDLAHLIAAEVGFQGEIFWDTTKPDGQPRRALNTSRAAELFGFRARTDFSEGLKRTIEWYRSTRGVRPHEAAGVL